MSLSTNEGDSDHLLKLQEQHGEEYEVQQKKKAIKTKESIQRKLKKRKVQETGKDGNDKKD